MHRSRLATIVIDCPESDADRGFEFWSRALGREALPADSPIYSSLRGRVGGDGGPIVLLQRVPAAERAVQATAAAAQARGLLPQYQTLAANAPALAIAAALGFELFATTLSADFSS